MMNATQLYSKIGDEFLPSNYWYCGKCHRMYGDFPIGEADAPERADQCCRPPVCEKHGEHTGHSCDKCWDEQRAQKLLERLAAAEVVADPDGWVFVEYCSQNNGFFESVAALREWWLECNYDDNGTPPLPEWAFCCHEESFRFDLDSALENECSEHHEDMRDNLNGERELQAAVDVFNEANKENVSYTPDYSRKVKIPALTAAESAEQDS